MKSLAAILAAFLENRTSRYNLLALFKLLVVLVLLICFYSVVFQMLMEREGQHHSWITGFYWTLTVMSTLGFGDITFETDAGRLFSVAVLITGVVFLLVLLPFTFIEFFYAPWMKAQEKAKAPQEIPSSTRGHVILTQYGPVTRMLTRLLDEYGYPYFVLVSALEEALDLHDRGVPVVLRDWGDSESFQKLAIENASMVVTTLGDIANTNVTFTVRELSDNIPIVASATTSSVRDALELAGVTHILQLEEVMGQALARRVIGNDAHAHVIGELDGGLLIAEASPTATPLSGKTIAETELRDRIGVTVVGLWIRGRFEPADATTEIGKSTTLVMAGTKEQIERYNDAFGQSNQQKNAVVVVGGGRVGRAVSRALTEAGIEWTMIEKLSKRVRGIDNTVIGDASEFEVLVQAGMRDAGSVIITTHDDDMNIFLTIFYRRLRNSMQIISRCSRERNAPRLHRAGADLVLSHGSMGANIIFNLLRGSGTVLLAEGVNVFTVKVPALLAGMTLKDSEMRSKTGCSIIAIELAGKREVNPGPEQLLSEGGNLVLIGSLDAEKKFLSVYKPEPVR